MIPGLLIMWIAVVQCIHGSAGRPSRRLPSQLSRAIIFSKQVAARVVLFFTGVATTVVPAYSIVAYP
jgi:hypothetical protein